MQSCYMKRERDLIDPFVRVVMVMSEFNRETNRERGILFEYNIGTSILPSYITAKMFYENTCYKVWLGAISLANNVGVKVSKMEILFDVWKFGFCCPFRFRITER